MKKELQVHERLLFIMRVTFVHLVVTIALVSFASAADISAQVLERLISIELKNVPLRQALVKIERITGVRFLYHSQLIPASERVFMTAVKDERLGNVLDKLLAEKGIQYEAEGNHIILTKSPRSHLPQEQGAAFNGFAEIPVLGTVTDEQNIPLPGVNILIKGTTTGTTTDGNGHYAISVPDENSILVFSFIGYAAHEAVVGARTEINVKMESDVRSLREVVVVGYGEQKKVNLTGSVATVNEEFLSSRPITNASQAVQGVPGLFVNQTKGRPGADGATIRIRGLGTLGNNDPLVLVDGVEFPLRDVNPSDIESISVLKDAASASIYGNRAANGVILVKTKKGKQGDSKIEYNNYFGFQEITQVPDVVWNSIDYMEGKNRALANEGKQPEYANALIQEYRDGLEQAAADPSLRYIYSNTNWFDEMFRKAWMQEHNLRFSGGNDKTTHSVSMSYLDQDGILLNTWAKRYSLNSSITTSLTEKLSLGVNLMGTYWIDRESAYTTDEGNGEGGIMGLAYRGLPMQVPYAIDGSYSDHWVRVPGHNFFRNPVALSYEGFKRNETLRAFSNIFIEYKLPFDITYRTTLAANISTGEQKIHNPLIELTHPKTGARAPMGNIPARQVRTDNKKSLSLTNFHTLQWQKNINSLHNLNVLGGFSAEVFTDKESYASIQGFAGNHVTELNGGSSSPQVGGTSSASRLTSFFGRVNYGLKDRYLLEVNYRYDGSSRFQEGQRWGFFPSISAGWRINEEDFLRDSEIVSNLKLRASWGKLGNQNIPLFTYVDAYFPGYNYSFNNVLFPGVAQRQVASNDLTWETTTMTDIGVDAGFFGNKLMIEFDYYDKLTEDILRQVNIAEQVGNLQGPYRNIGSVSNKGIDLAVNYRDEVGEVAYSIGGNLGYVTNEVVELNGEVIFTTNTITRENDPINSLYGLQAIGIFQSDAEVAQHPFQNNATKAGDIKYKDVVEDGIIDNRDRVVIGDLIPEFTYSITGNVAYQGLDLSFLWQGVQNVDTYMTGNISQPYRNGANVTKEWLTDSWTPDNTNAYLPRLTTSNGYPENFRISSFWVQDASYLRLKNIQLGYTLPSAVVERLRFKKVRVFANAQNLLTITDFKVGDPERNLSRADLIEYPNSKTITAGLNLTF